jgi:hypothetical protein
MKKSVKNQLEETEKALIAKRNNDVLIAVNELAYCCELKEYKPLLENILFHWISTNDGVVQEYLSDAICMIRSLMDLTETIAKIEESKDESMKPIKEAENYKSEIDKKDREIASLKANLKLVDADVETYKLLYGSSQDLYHSSKERAKRQEERADELEVFNRRLRPKINKPENYNCKLELVQS